MIAIDTNAIVHADREDAAVHASAVRAVRLLAEGDEAWAIFSFCAGDVLRVVSHDRRCDPPTPAGEAVDWMASLLTSPSARLLVPGDHVTRLLRSLIEASQVQGGLVFDAQIAAVCPEHGATTLLTEDRDVARVPELKPVALAAFLGG